MTVETGIPLPPPGAIGWVSGFLKEYDPESRRGTFVLADAQELPCRVMYVKPEELLGPELQQCAIYPETKKKRGLSLKVCGPTKTRREEQCRIVGEIWQIKGDEILVGLWSDRLQKNFIVSLTGFLAAEKGEYWRLFAVIEEGQLMLLDGEKLADTFDRSRFESAKPQAVTLIEATQNLTLV
jgi:hypothetical protein